VLFQACEKQRMIIPPIKSGFALFAAEVRQEVMAQHPGEPLVAISQLIDQMVRGINFFTIFALTDPRVDERIKFSSQVKRRFYVVERSQGE